MASVSQRVATAPEEILGLIVYEEFMEKSETAITRACLKWLKDNGGDGFHVHGSMFQRSGEPDICGEFYSTRLGSWLHLKVEVKTPEGHPSQLQLVRMRAYHKRGYVTGIVTSISDLNMLINLYESSYMGLGFGVPDPYGIYK